MTKFIKPTCIFMWRCVVMLRRMFIGNMRRLRCAETDRIYRAYGAHEARQLGDKVGLYWASPIWSRDRLLVAYADGLLNREFRFRSAGIPTLM
jgi:hypothetical protein